ncbi:MAG: SUMF1/EgtB/PvdO family nonheme iron enzyme, partial [Chloroflexi bacterium]|nr:SUMF1/EgtB/PvdO family nonheme iron enzyme [Chloroflexota bacterium]
TTVNINLLTHLERPRVFALIDSGLSFSAAKAQAQGEVLSAFNIAASAIGSSESLDISQPGAGNAILLAISVILQANRSEAQLTELLSTLSSDLRTDGVLDSAATRQKLIDGMEYVKPRRVAIRANILARYASLGAPATVPNFEAYAFALDATAPLVTAPSSGNLYAQNVNPVTVVFSELMQHATLSSNSVRLSDSAGNPVSGSLTISDSASSTSVVFTPNVKLALGLYPLTVANTVQDLAGNPLSSEKVVNLTIVEEPITGLISRHSATTLGETTFFTATVGSGSNVVYNWNFGNGATGSGHVVTYTYSTLGTYTVVVTAANSVSSVATQTFVYNGWVLIPAGDFQMGCDSSNPAETCSSDEQPLHTVTLDAYSIDKYEVTNARYKACVDAGRCTAPRRVDSQTRSPYYGTSTYADYPVISVDWHQASAFCAWAGGRLPTEAEWEKAARGSSDTRKYPWGDSAPDCTKTNYWYWPSPACVGDTSRVGSYPSGASPYGVMDMAGNVMEWVNDWYDGRYYIVSPAQNPQGPATGSYRMLRGGGSWYYLFSNDVRAALRFFYLNPDGWSNRDGFRCVRSP